MAYRNTQGQHVFCRPCFKKPTTHFALPCRRMQFGFHHQQRVNANVSGSRELNWLGVSGWLVCLTTHTGCFHHFHMQTHIHADDVTNQHRSAKCEIYKSGKTKVPFSLSASLTTSSFTSESHRSYCPRHATISRDGCSAVVKPTHVAQTLPFHNILT